MEPNLNIFSTKHPLLILLKLLRNIEVHLMSRRLLKQTKTFLWGQDRKEISSDILLTFPIIIDELKQLKGYQANTLRMKNHINI